MAAYISLLTHERAQSKHSKRRNAVVLGPSFGCIDIRSPQRDDLQSKQGSLRTTYHSGQRQRLDQDETPNSIGGT